MQNDAFEALKAEFANSDTDGKIAIYVDTDGLTRPQYRELLHMFPMADLNKLEAALV